LIKKVQGRHGNREYGEKKGGKVIDAKSEPFQPHTLLKHAEEATMNRMSRVESNVRQPDDNLHDSRRQHIGACANQIFLIMYYMY
jgi:hypothetical protein